jgi:hypothetical protein
VHNNPAVKDGFEPRDLLDQFIPLACFWNCAQPGMPMADSKIEKSQLASVPSLRMTSALDRAGRSRLETREPARRPVGIWLVTAFNSTSIAFESKKSEFLCDGLQRSVLGERFGNIAIS